MLREPCVTFSSSFVSVIVTTSYFCMCSLISVHLDRSPFAFQFASQIVGELLPASWVVGLVALPGLIVLVLEDPRVVFFSTTCFAFPADDFPPDAFTVVPAVLAVDGVVLIFLWVVSLLAWPPAHSTAGVVAGGAAISGSDTAIAADVVVDSVLGMAGEVARTGVGAVVVLAGSTVDVVGSAISRARATVSVGARVLAARAVPVASLIGFTVGGPGASVRIGTEAVAAMGAVRPVGAAVGAVGFVTSGAGATIRAGTGAVAAATRGAARLVSVASGNAELFSTSSSLVPVLAEPAPLVFPPVMSPLP